MINGYWTTGKTQMIVRRLCIAPDFWCRREYWPISVLSGKQAAQIHGNGGYIRILGPCGTRRYFVRRRL